MLRCQRVALVLVLCLGLGACFEPPVLETLDLRFLRDGSFVVTSTVEVSDSADNPQLGRRLARVRQELEEGSDTWGPRFAALEPIAERFAWEKQFGEVHRGTRAALAGGPENLRAFFGDTSLYVSYEVRDNVAEITITPGVPARASRRQREEVERIVDSWSGHVANYLKETGALWAYLDDRPDRAYASLGALYDDLLSDDTRKGLEPLADTEREQINRIRAAMQHVMDVLVVPEGADHAPDELSHLVYDPFPSRLTVRLPGPPLEAPEGFVVEDQKLVAVGPGLWQALRSLEGRWLAPDPVLLYVESAKPGKEEPVDLDALVTLPRRAEPAPSTDEVREALEDHLRTAPVYRVTFAVQPDADLTQEEIGWAP